LQTLLNGMIFIKILHFAKNGKRRGQTGRAKFEESFCRKCPSI